MAVTPLENKDSNSFKILIVEDSPSARFKIIDTLKGLDAVILEADDGTTALSILKQETETIDLVLSDLVMKVMHGDELCKTIREGLGFKDLPVIILSSKTDKDTILRLFQAGANDYLFKPFTPPELLARIQSHLEQRKLNKILKQTIQELSDLNRMKDHFLAACSHDFRSPLQGIMGFTELLMLEDSLNESHLDTLNSIMISVTQLHELIDSLLDFSLAGNKPEEISKIPMNLVSVVKSCVNNVQFSAKNKNIKIKTTPCMDLPTITGNPNALSRIFTNLLSNAVKFSSPEGLITIDFNNNGNESISISITDTGVGIAEDVIPIIFDRYSKASHKGTNGEKSTGLGLYITKQLVELHHGKIDVASQVNKGSCFTVTFPLKVQKSSISK